MQSTVNRLWSFKQVTVSQPDQVVKTGFGSESASILNMVKNHGGKPWWKNIVRLSLTPKTQDPGPRPVTNISSVRLSHWHRLARRFRAKDSKVAREVGETHGSLPNWSKLGTIWDIRGHFTDWFPCLDRMSLDTCWSSITPSSKQTWNEPGNPTPLLKILYFTQKKIKHYRTENVPKRSEYVRWNLHFLRVLVSVIRCCPQTLGHTTPLSPTGTCADSQIFISQDGPVAIDQS